MSFSNISDRHADQMLRTMEPAQEGHSREEEQGVPVKIETDVFVEAQLYSFGTR